VDDTVGGVVSGVDCGPLLPHADKVIMTVKIIAADNSDFVELFLIFPSRIIPLFYTRWQFRVSSPFLVEIGERLPLGFILLPSGEDHF